MVSMWDPTMMLILVNVLRFFYGHAMWSTVLSVSCVLDKNVYFLLLFGVFHKYEIALSGW